MNVVETKLEGVLEIHPKVYGDHRGFFVETFQSERYASHGCRIDYVQDNLSLSAPGILRGLHLQHPKDQAKLVWVLQGKVFDVAVDVRVGSPTFGQHVTQVLDWERKNQLFMSEGFAHGFAVLGDEPALFAYKCTELYAPEHEITVQWNDPALGIEWPIDDPKLSDKDQKGIPLAEIDPEILPRWKG